jgi:type II secretory ATPase GspE/PulE/Tfp pilus assembly ATPase PilB-like protein
LQSLGFSPEMLQRYIRMISRPHGVLLVTGPTGSGKSTTLYASLRHIYTPEKKILTLEDPVEAKIPGVTQFQMNSAIGFTFARALRSVLRHDPEIVLVGEIRDQETAEIAIRASLTGHLLLSTLHTNDATSAPTRLIDMGVPGYLVMTSLLGVLAQRLIRRLCPRCRQPLVVDPGQLRSLGLETLPPGATIHRPVGCGECQNRGYRGRVAIYELLEITPAMRRLPEAELTSERLLQMATAEGFVSLRQSAVASWLQGLTSFEEVMKVTVE